MNLTYLPGRFTARRGIITLALAALTLQGSPTGATEQGGSSYPVGVELGYGDMLPPGVYNLAYFSHAEASSLKGNSGQDLGWARYRLTADTISYRMQYVWDTTLIGASVETALVLPFPAIDLEKRVSSALPDTSGRRFGMTDPLLVPLRLTWRGESINHSAALEIIAPLGAYDVNAKVNTGRNYWQFAPAYALTWRPTAEIPIGLKLRYGINTRNKDSHYQSGDELTLEYNVGYKLSPAMTLGFQGYFFRQTTDDELNGQATSATNGRLFGSGIGNRGSTNTIGPFLSYRFSPRFAVTAKYQQDYDVKNRGEFKRFWLQTLLPF
ncbi:Phenol degradation protein MetA [Georgfuchsia toluolica]|uniref:Phenol degradation protein MetA n=1 Tax=Georgfuchsia toluolica TaxID=424218 RepID=A0A916J475_9PROT|nr:transporter [Georgfuchsia toluolica]CAG4883078.1 Phenol degradation protein MetA [Georgfuchsia toluolica]